MGWSSLEVYYTPGSPHCRAVLMCLKALNLDADLNKLDTYQKFEHRKPWFVKMNPQRTVPTINDDGFILWESHAILCYLVNKYAATTDNPEESAKLYPKDSELRAKVDRMLFFDSGTLYKNIIDYFHPMLMTGEGSDERKENALKTSLDHLDEFLEDQQYVAGGDHISVADFAILASVNQLQGMDYKLQGYKNVSRWLDKLKRELPYYEECNKDGIEMFRNWANAQKGHLSK